MQICQSYSQKHFFQFVISVSMNTLNPLVSYIFLAI
jgi:hypothetical protein